MKQQSVNSHFVTTCISIFSKYRTGYVFQYDQGIFSCFDIKLNECGSDVKTANKQAGEENSSPKIPFQFYRFSLMNFSIPHLQPFHENIAWDDSPKTV